MDSSEKETTEKEFTKERGSNHSKGEEVINCNGSFLFREKPSKAEKASEKDDVKLKITLKEAILANLIVGALAVAIYIPLEFVTDRPIFGLTGYSRHVVLAIICFVALPISYLIVFYLKTGKGKYLFTTTKKGLRPKKIISSLIQGCAMHAGLFYPWVLLSQRFMNNVVPLTYYLPKAIDWFLWLFFVALNVIMFEFYSKAFVQIQFSEAKGMLSLFKGKIKLSGGKMMGFVLQNLYWLVGHIQELLWLKEYLGVANSIAFIVVSGILTGLTVLETGNIFGVTVGHVLLNVLITITYANY